MYILLVRENFVTYPRSEWTVDEVLIDFCSTTKDKLTPAQLNDWYQIACLHTGIKFDVNSRTHWLIQDWNEWFVNDGDDFQREWEKWLESDQGLLVKMKLDLINKNKSRGKLVQFKRMTE